MQGSIETKNTETEDKARRAFFCYDDEEKQTTYNAINIDEGIKESKEKVLNEVIINHYFNSHKETTNLNISGSTVAAKKIIPLAPETITTLELVLCEVPLDFISKHMPQLKVLLLHRNPIEEAEHLASFKELQEFIYLGNPITSALLEQLKNHTSKITSKIKCILCDKLPEDKAEKEKCLDILKELKSKDIKIMSDHKEIIRALDLDQDIPASQASTEAYSPSDGEDSEVEINDNGITIPPAPPPIDVSQLTEKELEQLPDPRNSKRKAEQPLPGKQNKIKKG